MKRLITAAILLAFNCALVVAQQIDKPNAKPAITIRTAATEPRNDSSSLELLVPGLKLSQDPKSDLLRLSDQITTPASSFVVVKGAIYVRVGEFLMPMPGGGASGCFSLDLPQRMTNLKEFTLKLPETPKP
jgi:hypothetical protein